MEVLISSSFQRCLPKHCALPGEDEWRILAHPRGWGEEGGRRFSLFALDPLKPHWLFSWSLFVFLAFSVLPLLFPLNFVPRDCEYNDNA